MVRCRLRRSFWRSSFVILAGSRSAPLDKTGALVRGVLEGDLRCGPVGAGEVDVVEAVVLAAAVGEAAFPCPGLAPNLVQDEPGLLGDLAPRSVLELSPESWPPPGSSHQWWPGSWGSRAWMSRTSSSRLRSRTRAPTRRAGSLATVIRWVLVLGSWRGGRARAPGFRRALPRGPRPGRTLSVVDHYPRPGIVYRPVRDAEPVDVRLAWWRDNPHPATRTVRELLTELYRT
jgi:hypothetical protein